MQKRVADRRAEILRYIPTGSRGIEIGAWHFPLVRKSEGYDVYKLDFFNQEQLIERLRVCEGFVEEWVANVEPVDIIGNVVDIAEITEQAGIAPGSLDFVISSHNFEHIPDPIRFLQGAAKVLKPGGIIAMAMPDRRTSIDYYTPHTITADLLEAYFRRDRRPSQRKIFGHNSLAARYRREDRLDYACDIDESPFAFEPEENLEKNFQDWKSFEENPTEDYCDTHLWCYTPSALEVVIRDLRFLGVINMEIVEIVPQTPGGFRDIYLHLRNSDKPDQTPREEFYRRRRELLARIADENARNTRLAQALFMEIDRLKAKDTDSKAPARSYPHRAEAAEILKDPFLDHPIANISGLLSAEEEKLDTISEVALIQSTVRLYRDFLQAVVAHPEMASGGKIIDSRKYVEQVRHAAYLPTFTAAKSAAYLMRLACGKAGLAMHVDMFIGCVCAACADRALRNGELRSAAEALQDALTLNPADEFIRSLAVASSQDANAQSA